MTRTLDELPDSEFTEAQVRELRELGLPKPRHLLQERWDNCSSGNYKTQYLVELAAQGESTREIAEKLEADEKWVERQLLREEIKQQISAIQQTVIAKDPRAYIKALMPRAFENIKEILDSKTAKESTKASVAIYLIDQGIGKARQEIEHKGGLLVEFLAKLDHVEKQGYLRDVTKSKLDRPKSSLEAFVEDNIPDGVNVGVKKNGGSESQAG